MITLATLKDATSQQVFDHVAKHLLTQNMQSARNGNCKYRGDGGLMCAAGCLMSDDEYAEINKRHEIDVLHGKNWGFLSDCTDAVPEIHSSLIQDLQIVHDSPIGTINWKAGLEKVSIDHELNDDILKAFE